MRLTCHDAWRVTEGLCHGVAPRPPLQVRPKDYLAPEPRHRQTVLDEVKTGSGEGDTH